jgi:hypothetical protein
MKKMFLFLSLQLLITNFSLLTATENEAYTVDENSTYTETTPTHLVDAETFYGKVDNFSPQEQLIEQAGQTISASKEYRNVQPTEKKGREIAGKDSVEAQWTDEAKVLHEDLE